MTDPSICFKKQVKSNIVSLFWIILSIVVTFWPLMITLTWMFSLPNATNDIELTKYMNDSMFVFLIGAIFNCFWAVIIALPFIKCYIDTPEVEGRND
jgi:ABC-type phosphate transport system permease subunit